jgi:predicted transcriptional regulator
MRVQEIMSTSLKTVPPTMSADDAWQKMRAERIRHLVVTDGRSIAGVLSDRDVGGARGTSIRAGHQVSEMMTSHVVTVPENTTIKRAANLLRGRSIGSVVVTDKGRPIGIVTTADLLELLGRGAVRPTPTSKRAPLNFRAPHRKRNRAYGVW